MEELIPQVLAFGASLILGLTGAWAAKSLVRWVQRRQ